MEPGSCVPGTHHAVCPSSRAASLSQTLPQSQKIFQRLERLWLLTSGKLLGSIELTQEGSQGPHVST